MIEKLSDGTDAISDDEIVRLAEKRIKTYLAGKPVELFGLSGAFEWTEQASKQPCGVCDNGRSLERHQPAICLKCFRADAKFNKFLATIASWEQRMLAMQGVLSEARIKRQAELQRIGRKHSRSKVDKPLTKSDAVRGLLERVKSECHGGR
jgi:hypothetical protein